MRNFSCASRYRRDASVAAGLLKLLGQEKFAVVQQFFGGRRVWIPKKGSRMPCAACAERTACIRKWRKSGHSPLEIAADQGISQKSVYRILGPCSQRRRK